MAVAALYDIRQACTVLDELLEQQMDVKLSETEFKIKLRQLEVRKT